MNTKAKASNHNYKVAILKGNTTRHYTTGAAILATHQAPQARQANLKSSPLPPSNIPLAQDRSSQRQAVGVQKTPTIAPQPCGKVEQAASPKISLLPPNSEPKRPTTAQAQSNSQLPHAPVAAHTTSIAVFAA